MRSQGVKSFYINYGRYQRERFGSDWPVIGYSYKMVFDVDLECGVISLRDIEGEMEPVNCRLFAMNFMAEWMSRIETWTLTGINQVLVEMIEKSGVEVDFNFVDLGLFWAREHGPDEYNASLIYVEDSEQNIWWKKLQEEGIIDG